MKLPLGARFAVLSLLAVVGLAVAMSWTMSAQLTRAMTEWEWTNTAAFVRWEVEHLGLDAFFTAPPAPEERLLWARKLQHTFASLPEVVHVNVWDRAATILWSDWPELIGQRFPENPDLQRALRGQVFVRIKEPSKAKNLLEGQRFRALVALYVPILSKTSGDLIGVLEVYKTPARLLAMTRWGQILIWTISLAGSLVLYAILIPLIRRVYRHEVEERTLRAASARLDEEVAARTRELQNKAEENARLYKETERRRRAAESLAQVGHLISQSLDPAEVGQRIVENLCALFGARMSALYRLEPGSEDLVLVACEGPTVEWNQVLPRGTATVGLAVRERRPVATADVLSDPRIFLTPETRAHIERSEYHAVLAVPLMAKERVIGAIGIGDHAGRAFGPEEIGLAQAFADQAALALENARLFRRADERAEKLAALSTLTRRITSAKDSREVFNAVAEAAATLLGAKMARVWVDDPGDRVLRAHGNFSADAKFVQLITDFSTIPYGTGVIGPVFASRAPAFIRDVQQDGRWVNQQMARVADLHAFAGLPLITADRVVGVLSILFGARDQFTPEEQELMGLLADQAAIAIEQSRLIEELRRSYEEIQRAQDQLVRSEKLRALGEMAGGVAHDFNNVLAVILGRARLLLDQTEEPELQRQLKVIEKAALDGAQTLRRIQEFTRMRQARALQPVDLNHVVQDVVEITRSRWKDEAQSKGIGYDIRVETRPLPPVAGNPSELREALTNLVLNALDAMPEGGRVTFTTQVEGERVSCVVSDTGSGMPEEVRQRVFDPFFTTKGERGTGLGLSMVYGIITRHGGEIEVQSLVGQGSVFTIRLPVGQHIPEAPPSVPPAPAGRSGKILVIDDEPDIREVLCELLAHQGHAVAACADGRAGLTRLQEEAFDLVITDLGMPGLSGWDVVSQLKLLRPALPVVLLTGWGDRIDSDEAWRKGVDFLLAKPFRSVDLAEVVGQALSAR